ncbi:hydrolase [Uliginosibacterium gangwonense]|uniref:hydrolase n=1 Tax=Uliginosibacterium gangwonense TaxID=392736 RepID=UPI0003828350|nr:hydrolase [Uliginosibacterium gangwonense]
MHYEAPSWLKGPHAQTIWPLLIKGSRPKLRRKRWATPDGDFIDLDFLPTQDKKPLLILFHGLEGSSRSHYARSLMRAAYARGWNGVVVHFRGCSGEPNKLPRAYHSGDADELDWILRKLAQRYPGVPRYAAGVSLGGNALLCWLGTRGPKAYKYIQKAAAISAPMDLSISGHVLGQGFNRVYTQYFLSTLQKAVRHKAKRFPGLFNAEHAQKARTLREFDDAYTAPMHGFRNAEDYWRRASAKPLLQHIQLPTLVLNARNDPFLPAQALPTRFDVSPMVVLDQPEEGGHVGFVSGTFPGNLDWMPNRVLRYFESNDA